MSDLLQKLLSFDNTVIECTKCGWQARPLDGELSSHFHKSKGKWASQCKECVNKKKRAKAMTDRIMALQHYSKSDIPFCGCCGTTEISWLCFNHINGDGAKHRKELGEGGDRILRFFKKNGYIDGINVLCHNCNASRSTRSECPHEIQRRIKVAIHNA